MADKQSDFIEQLFNSISSDPTMPAELKISLLRLQLPMHRLCQSEPHFITNDKHPARRTLNIVKRLSLFAKSDASLVSKINLILSDLVKATSNANNFGRVNQSLELLNQNLHSKNSDQCVSRNISSDKRKLILNRMIKQCIQGRQIPAPCQNLVLKLWPNTLFYLLKSHGEQSSHLINAISMYSDLLDSIQKIESNAQQRQLKDRFMSIARTNNNFLLIYHQESKVEPAIKALIGHYNDMLGNTKLTRRAADKNSHSVSEKISGLPSVIKPGIWCEIYIDDITPARRLRLSLINMDTGMLIFVNRKGIKKLEKDAMEFTYELKRGLSKAYNHDALFDRPSGKTQYQKIG